MYRVWMTHFQLHPQLAKDTKPVADLGLCQLLLMDDSRFPWLIAVPKRPMVTEIHDLSPLDQTMLTFEISQISEMLKAVTGCHKINVAALGNMVPQLHVHIIARNTDDAAWPGPVWGKGDAEHYSEADAAAFIEGLAEHI